MKKSSAAEEVAKYFNIQEQVDPRSSLEDWMLTVKSVPGMTNSSAMSRGKSGAGNALDVTDGEFEALSPESAAKRFDQDVIFQLDSSKSSIGWNTVVPDPNASSLYNVTIGTYFQARSGYPDGLCEVDTDMEEGIRGMSTLEQASAAPFSEAGGIGLRLTDIRQSSIIQNAQEKSLARKGTEVELEPEVPRNCTFSANREDSITDFLVGSASNGLSSESMINSILNYCQSMSQAQVRNSVPKEVISKYFKERGISYPLVGSRGESVGESANLDVVIRRLSETQTQKPIANRMLGELTNIEEEAALRWYETKHDTSVKRTKTESITNALDRMNANIEDTFSQGIMDISRISSIRNSPPHSSTPKKDTQVEADRRSGRSVKSLKLESRVNVESRVLVSDPLPVRPHVVTDERDPISKAIEPKNHQEKEEPSPNSSISSGGTTASNAATQCQLQVFTSQQSSFPPNNCGIAQMHSCLCVQQRSLQGMAHPTVVAPVSRPDSRQSTTSLSDSQPHPPSCCHAQSTMVPMMPVLMPVYQLPLQTLHNQQCQCRCHNNCCH